MKTFRHIDIHIYGLIRERRDTDNKQLISRISELYDKLNNQTGEISLLRYNLDTAKNEIRELRSRLIELEDNYQNFI